MSAPRPSKLWWCKPTKAQEKGAEHADYRSRLPSGLSTNRICGYRDGRTTRAATWAPRRSGEVLPRSGVTRGAGAGGHGSQWTGTLVCAIAGAEFNFELWIGDLAKIRAKRVRKQKTDRRDAQLILRLMLKDDFPPIWTGSSERTGSNWPARTSAGAFRRVSRAPLARNWPCKRCLAFSPTPIVTILRWVPVVRPLIDDI
jgi:hypothetical protein